jgi:hypothetical protein
MFSRPPNNTTLPCNVAVAAPDRALGPGTICWVQLAPSQVQVSSRDSSTSIALRLMPPNSKTPVSLPTTHVPAVQVWDVAAHTEHAPPPVPHAAELFPARHELAEQHPGHVESQTHAPSTQLCPELQCGVHSGPDSRPSVCGPASPDSVADESPVLAPHASPGSASARHATAVDHAFVVAVTAAKVPLEPGHDLSRWSMPLTLGARAAASRRRHAKRSTESERGPGSERRRSAGKMRAVQCEAARGSLFFSARQLRGSARQLQCSSGHTRSGLFHVISRICTRVQTLARRLPRGPHRMNEAARIRAAPLVRHHRQLPLSPRSRRSSRSGVSAGICKARRSAA